MIQKIAVSFKEANMGKSLILMVTKVDCPYCEKAKQLLQERGLRWEERVVSSLEEARALEGIKFPLEQTTVPAIWIGEEFIGGYDKLKARFTPIKTKKTIFNSEATGHITGNYPLFLGESAGFADTINNPYPELETLFQTQQSFHWNEFEVDLTQDRQQMITAPAGTVDLMVKTLLWQSLVDSVAARSITGVLMDMVSNPTLEGLYNIMAYFETIHSRTYLHIIKQTFVDPNGALIQGYADQEIMGRSKVLREAFDDLLNLAFDEDIAVRRKALYKALIALYMLEALNFMASFAITFGIAETGLFQGIAQNVSLICRDEMLHARAGKYILGVEMQEHPEVFVELQKETEAIFYEILRGEEEWTDLLFSDGRFCKNINAERIKRYVHYAAGPVAKTLKIPGFEIVKENPLPYMDDWTDSTNVQVAPQELQLSAYLVNSVKATSDPEALIRELKKLAKDSFSCPAL